MLDSTWNAAENHRSCLLGVTGLFHTSGGIAAVNRNVILALSEENFHIDLISLTETDSSIDSRYVDPSKVKVDVSGGSKFRFTRKLWQAAISKNYSLIFIDHINLASVLFPLKIARGLRYAVWLFGAELFPPRPDIEGKLGLRYAWKRLAISNYTRDRLHSRFPNMHAAVCELALDPVAHNDMSQSELSSLDNIYLGLHALDGQEHILGIQVILHVGRMPVLGRDKGQRVLIKAFPQIVEQYPDAQLVLAGGGDGKRELLNSAKMLPQAMHSRIFLPGHVDNQLLDRLFRSCYLFAMPSIGEGFGLVYIEAMSRKKPCLGARADATPYLVRDGETGLLVDNPTSHKEVASKIIWLLANQNEAARMGNAGHDLVQKHYQFPEFKRRFFKALWD